MESSRDDAVARAATWYHERYFWPVDVVNNEIQLPLGQGVVAFDVPAGRVPRMQKVLELNGIRTPAYLVPKPEPRVVYLAEADEVVLGQYQMPADVRFLAAPSALPLPLMPTGPSNGRKWLWPPDPGQRWLPPASAVLAAVNAATPSSLRARTRIRPADKERILIG